MVNAVDATALAIFMFEGARLGNPNVRCIRNNNPGNLRPFNKVQTTDADNYRTFPTFVEGYEALVTDIEVKLAKHLQPTDNMETFFNLYAPGADHNDPKGYAQYVCSWLSDSLGKTITLNSTIAEIFSK